MKRTIIALCMAAVSVASIAGAEEGGVEKRAFEIQPSRHELSVDLGYQAGYGGSYGSASGIKITGDYAYKFHPLAWFDVQLGNVFGFGGKDGRCAGGSFDSNCYRGGWDLSIAAGVRLKFKTRIPVVLEVPLLVGIDVLYNRNCGDNGATFPVIRPGFRAKYFVTPRIGLGAGLNAALGPAFHSGGNSACTSNSYTDFYGAFDFMMGAEFML
jgi:hypothetical protein